MSVPIPQPSGVPLLGNLFDVDPNNTWESLRKLSEKYGEIFQIKVLGQTIVFVTGAAIAEELCDEKRFRKYVGGPIVEIRYAVHDALFTAYDNEESWGIAHRILAPKLSQQALKDHFVEMRDLADELIEKWKGLGNDNEVSAVGELNKLNLEATTLTLFGKKLNGLYGPGLPMLQAMEDSTSEAMKRPTRPGLLNKLWYGRKFSSATTTMRAYAQDLIDYRKANPTDRQDMLAAMMSAKDPKTGEALKDSQVIDEIVTMPIGSSTAPALIATAIYFLLKNPSVIAKAREELDTVIGAGEAFTFEHLSQLKYIEAIVRESLRLSFAAPGFNIEPIPSDSKAPVQLAGGKYQIAHNQAMIIVLAGVNRDPAVFDEPLAFKPERMMGQAFDDLPQGAKKWFGNGKRQCIGIHWAWQWSMTTLVKLLRDVDFEMADPSYKLEQDGWFNLRPVGFQVRVKSRTN
ncbi:bifunctional P-450:NADPH-P450 reductase [Hypoxylon fragiforme]|uniref:bifunctional P-450:NADPH-P450 reductase n=1 Tax=Hypoxylon fragiforme TaxID=63214 RepID=UPI0020C7439D|nr:bifunctional P-450:NADPH-P450 reductase [Hypoxylon fragiforme]KAI2605388.1 bifunctional P-450:NADPH-P450 reductase [Hypoxylon fragiforme]